MSVGGGNFTPLATQLDTAKRVTRGLSVGGSLIVDGQPMRPPSLVYLAASECKFMTTCSNWEASAFSQIGCGGNETVSSCPCVGRPKG